MKNSYKGKLVASFILFFASHNLFPQSVSYDVLPLTGRNELFHTYLMNTVDTLSARRKEAVDSMTTIAKVQARQNQLRQDFLNLLGPMPLKTPLNPTVVSTITGAGYNIEKISYESSPNHHVTANFYIPATGTAPYPTLLVTCGHYPTAKSVNVLQSLCIILATNGIAALIVDPIEQGERNQIENPSTSVLTFLNQSGTAAHSRLDVGATLSGTSVVAYELWDNHRGIDYIYSRTDVVDTTKVGCTGGSGGGAQATYLCAYDNRIKVAAVTSYLMDEPTLYKTIGPQTASQNLSYEGEYGIDHPEFITMFAPKPFMIIGATNDFFDITATRTTYTEANKVYKTLGDTTKIAFVEYNDGHDWTTAKRQSAVKWFRTWFYNDTVSVTEGVYTFLSTAQLQVTSTGQVMTDYAGEKSVVDLNIDLANAYQFQRDTFWLNNPKDTCLKKVKELIKFESYDTPVLERVDTIDRTSYIIEKIKITSGVDVPVTGLLFKPNGIVGKVPVVLYVDGRGKNTDAAGGGIIEQLYVNTGKIVLAIDLRGFGETADDPLKNETKHGNNEHRNAVISLYAGKTFIGQRVADIMKALDMLDSIPEADTSNITLVGIDRAGIVALHLAALDKRVKNTYIKNSDTTFMSIVSAPTVLNNMTHVVPNALMYYDLTDLKKSIAPRTLQYVSQLPNGIIKWSNTANNNNTLLGQNYPNPFQYNTNIPFQVKEAGMVTLKIFDNNGNEMKTLVNGFHSEGKYVYQLQVDSFVPEIYFYQLQVGESKSSMRKMVLVP